MEYEAAGHITIESQSLFVCYFREGSFLGKVFPNPWTYPPNLGFLRNLGTRKVKFGFKTAVFGVIWGGG